MLHPRHDETVAPPVSVIIPLEFHRGQAGDCLDRWLTGQTWPREDFEIVLTCPPGFPHAERRAIESKMAPWDRLVELPLHHDIALVEQGALLARGQIFFFTESHVLPEAETLAKVMQGFQDHPEWAGFSLKSVPLTHNFLSGIEAEFYEMGIRQSDSKPDWLQVLDQCFAVRREPYFAVGGFQAEYGHYAEWVLAARLHAAGHQIGYYPEGRIHHYYIGKLRELEEFTEDFARGHWRWFAQTPREPAHALMQEPEVSARRFEHRREFVRVLSEMSALSPGAAPVRQYWQVARWLGPHSALWRTRVNYWIVKAQLAWRCFLKKPSALTSLIDLSRAIVDIAHLREMPQMSDGPSGLLPENGVWKATDDSIPSAGLYAAENVEGKLFRWSQPAALMELHLAPGRYHVELEWLALRPDMLEPQLFFNGQPVPQAKHRRFKFRVRVTWHQKSVEPLLLGWTCPPFEAANDRRLLAVPIHRISWQKQPAYLPSAGISADLPLHAEAETHH